MTKKKLDPMEALHTTEYRNAAMVYLHEDRNMSFEFLADATGLALSTVKTYIKYKFAHLITWAREIFRKAKNFTRKIIRESYFVYIDKITFKDGKCWCKIGQTTQDPEKRADQICSKGWQNGRVKPSSVIVTHVIECKDETSMTNMEDCLRLGMTAINPDKFCPNDRLLDWNNDYPERILKNPFVQMGLQQFAV